MVQRSGGLDVPGLFRDVRFRLTQQMIDAIDAGLEGMFDPGQYRVSSPADWPDYRLDCLHYGFHFHTGVPQTQLIAQAEASVGAFRLMLRLFLDDLRSGRKIFVYRHDDAEQTAPDLMDRLFDALRRHGPACLAFIAPGGEPDGHVERRRDGLIACAMPAHDLSAIDVAAWENMLRRVIDARDHRDAGPVGVHTGPGGRDGPLFAVQWEDLDPGTRLMVQAEVNIPADSPATGAGLTFWGFPSHADRRIDPNRRGAWQDVAVSTTVPAGGDRAVAALHAVGGAGSVRLLSRNWRIRSQRPRRSYAVVHRAALPQDAIERVITHADIDLALAPIAFGQIRRPDFPVREFPAGDWEEQSIRLGNIASVTLRDAVVHGAEGIVTFGDNILFESLRLARFGGRFLAWEERGRVSLEVQPPSLSLPAGAHLFCGWAGVHNYAHFLVDMLPGAVPPFTPLGLPLLWPAAPYPWHDAYLNLLGIGPRSFRVAGTVACGLLHMPAPSLIDSGHFPHPDRMALIAELKKRVGCDPARRRDLYIARTDTRTRPLANEAALIQMLTARGFEVLELSRMTVPAQIAAFAEAGRVVAPHGAGLANVIFCRPGAVFLELHGDSYVQWSMRRLASLVPLRYGCVVGRQVDAAWPDQPNHAPGPWTVDLANVAAALDAAG